MSFKVHADLERDGILLGHFSLCQVRLINDSAYPWFVLIPQRANIRDPFELTPEDHQRLWEESRAFSSGIMHAFAGEKLNVAALGNVTPQLHVHHIVRYATDPAWPGPIWGKQPLTPYTEIQIKKICEKLANVEIPKLTLT